MNLKKRKACLAMLVLLCANIHAQQTMWITPDEAVDMAIKNNLGLESSRVDLATKKRASDLSWNQFIPSVTAGGSLVRDNEISTSTGYVPVDLSPLLPGVPPDTVYGVYPYSVDVSRWHIAYSIQASLNLSLSMFENMKRLRTDYHGGLMSYEKAKIQLERDVRKAYHDMLLLKENIALLYVNFENTQRQVQMAQANYNAGLAPELTLLQARVALENMRPVIDQAESGLKVSMAQFAMFLGLDYDANFELAPVDEDIYLIPLDVAEMISKASTGKPDIQELRYTILMMQSARKAQVYSLFPYLALSWNHTSAFAYNPWKDSWGTSDSWIKSGSLTISLGIRLNSLIPFSTDYQGIKNLDDQIRTATIGLAQMINGTEIEIYNIILSLERIIKNTAALEQTVNLAEQSYRLTEQAYRAGLQDYFQVQSAEQSLNQARVQVLEQQFNYLKGLIDLEYSLGVPFGTLSQRSR